MNKISDFSRQFEYLQPEKPSGFENEMSSKKHLQSIYSRVWQKGPPPLGLIGLKKVLRIRSKTGICSFFGAIG